MSDLTETWAEKTVTFHVDKVVLVLVDSVPSDPPLAPCLFPSDTEGYIALMK
jgi:hypothetical protein